jgi:hypothetical protein
VVGVLTSRSIFSTSAITVCNPEAPAAAADSVSIARHSGPLHEPLFGRPRAPPGAVLGG